MLVTLNSFQGPFRSMGAVREKGGWQGCASTQVEACEAGWMLKQVQNDDGLEELAFGFRR
jgi:hypothetical protein